MPRTIGRSAMLLRHLGQAEDATRIENAVLDFLRTASSEELTGDLGGSGTTTGVTEAIIKRLQ